MNKKIDSMKPIKTKTQNDKSIIFNRMGYPIKKHPIVIFYDEQEETYFYIKARSSFDRELKQGEIEINSSKQGLFKHNSFVDTTQIFKINLSLLEKVMDKDLLKTTYSLSREIGELIYLEILENLKQNPPKISLVEVQEKDDILIGKTLYSEYKLLDNEYYEMLNTKPQNEKEYIDRFNSIINRSESQEAQKELNDLMRNVELTLDEYIKDNWTSDEIKHKANISLQNYKNINHYKEEQEKKSNSKTEEELGM